MKLAKLSLAAALVAGAFSTVSATPLEEVIKDVDLSGMARLRYHYNTTKFKGGDDKSYDGHFQWKIVSTLKTNIDDNFFGVISYVYNDTDNRGAWSDGVVKDSGESHHFNLEQIYLGYKVGGTTLQAGRQTLGTFFTDDLYGTGIKMVNTDVEGLTLAALAMDNLHNDGDIASAGLGQIVGGHRYTYEQNLYGVAAIGAYDPVAFQVWAAYLQDVTWLFATELKFDVPVTDDIKLGLRAQYGHSALKKSFKNDVATALGVKAGNSNYWGIEAGTSLFGFDLKAGWVTYGKKNEYSLHSFEEVGGFIFYGQNLLYQHDAPGGHTDYTLFRGKNKAWFVKASYTIPQTDVTLTYEYADQESKYMGSKTDYSEHVVRANYQYNKKLNFYAHFAHLVTKNKDANYKKTYDAFRFQTVYKF